MHDKTIRASTLSILELGRPPIGLKTGPPISTDKNELTRVIKNGRRENGRLMRLPQVTAHFF